MCKWKLRSRWKKSKSFLPPSLVFYPLFLALKFAQISCSQLIYAQLSMLQKWGKKLVRGVKNFWIVKYDISAFFGTKNHVLFASTKKSFVIKPLLQFWVWHLHLIWLWSQNVLGDSFESIGRWLFEKNWIMGALLPSQIFPMTKEAEVENVEKLLFLYQSSVDWKYQKVCD